MKDSLPESLKANTIQIGLTMDAKVRYLIVEASAIIQQLCQRHQLSPFASKVFAESMIATSLLASQIKDQEHLAVQLQSQNPKILFLCEITAEGKIRGKITPTDLQGNLENPILDGHLLSIKHNQKKELYRGWTEINQQSIQDALQHHINQSSQIDNYIRIVVMLNTEGDIEQAFGIFVERYPESPNNPSATVEEFQETYHALLQANNETIVQNLHRSLILGHTLFPLESKELYWECMCSQSNTEKMLKGLGKEELESILDELGQAEVTCEYCKEVYLCDANCLKTLIQQLQ